MADNTQIEWTDATWNPITGCSIVSPGCTNCYAMKLAGTRLKHIPSRKGLTTQSKAGPVWNGQVRFNEEFLLQPLLWKKPRMIFVCAHGDLFAEGVRDEWIDQIFAVMALAPQHTFQVLTKRPERMRDYLTRPRWRPVVDFGQDEQPSYWVAEAAGKIWCRLPSMGIRAPDHIRTFGQMADFERSIRVGVQTMWPLKNVWLGVSAEDQKRADQRIPVLLTTPAATRWLSAEPLLGPLELLKNIGGTLWIGGQRGCDGTHKHNGVRGQVIHEQYHSVDPTSDHHHHDDRCGPGLDWVVVGGESGPGARPMHPEWATKLRDQCAEAGVPFFFKQWGNWKPVPWKLEREEAETDEQYIERSEKECSVHAISSTGYLIEMDHKPWSWGRALPAPSSHHSVKNVGKTRAGRLLDGVTHDAFPKIERIA